MYCTITSALLVHSQVPYNSKIVLNCYSSLDISFKLYYAIEISVWNNLILTNHST